MEYLSINFICHILKIIFKIEVQNKPNIFKFIRNIIQYINEEE